MKLPKSDRAAARELERVVSKVLSRIDTTQEIQKEDFGLMLETIMLQVVKNRGLDINEVALSTPEVIEGMTEYSEIPEEVRGWESLVAFLYLKYHDVLDIDTRAFQL
ncbi:MAG: hypothetical protein WBA57_11600 [Elainellaceae cyanobacterium]